MPPTGKHKSTVLPIQAMAREGSQAAGERDEWAAEARAARRAAATAEQLARSHASELADARKAYQVRRPWSCPYRCHPLPRTATHTTQLSSHHQCHEVRL